MQSTTSGGDFLKMRSNNTSNVSGGVGLVHVDYASHILDTINYWGANIFSSSSNHWFNGDPVTAGVKAAMLWLSSSNVYAYNVKGTSSSDQNYWLLELNDLDENGIYENIEYYIKQSLGKWNK